MEISKIDFDLIKPIIEPYKISIKKISHIEFGTQRMTFLVESMDNNRYILKLFNLKNLVSICKEIQLLKEVSKSKMLICPMNEQPLIIKDRIGYLYQYIEGKRVSSLRADKINRYGIGKVIGKVDLVLNKLDYGLSEEEELKKRYFKSRVTNNHFYDIDKINSELDRKRNEINFSMIRKQYLHRDIHFDNIIFNQKLDTYKVIDTNSLKLDYLPREIAVVIGNELYQNQGDIYCDSISNILQGYLSIFRLSEYELSSIPYFILIKKLGELNFLEQQFQNKNITSELYLEHIAISKKGFHFGYDNYSKLQYFFQKFKV